MTMIEKVARALALQHEINYGFENPSEINWPDFDKSAKAAIEAMREPTPAIEKRMWGVCDISVWTDCVHAALKED